MSWLVSLCWPLQEQHKPVFNRGEFQWTSEIATPAEFNLSENEPRALSEFHCSTLQVFLTMNHLHVLIADIACQRIKVSGFGHRSFLAARGIGSVIENDVEQICWLLVSDRHNGAEVYEKTRVSVNHHYSRCRLGHSDPEPD